MTPILVRPVREQLEHDRIIRFLQARRKRRYEVAANVGDATMNPVRVGTITVYPDLVLMSLARGRKVEAVVEIETTESVNNLEALAQWAHLAKVRAPFHLYVPAGSVEIARRLCSDNQIAVSEIWSYYSVGDQIRFTMVHRAERPTDRRREAVRPRNTAAGRKSTARGTRAKKSRAPKKPARTAKRK